MRDQASGVFITAADTGAGKTTLACGLIPALEARGVMLRVRKPVESGCTLIDGELVAADARAITASLQRPIPARTVCPYTFESAASPARAARLEGKRIRLDMLAAACAGEADEFLLVEGAGGICSPLCDDALNIDLACALHLPLIIVSEDRLGCISQTLAALDAAAARRRPVVAVVLNQTSPPDAAHATDNPAELREWTDAPVLHVGHGERPDECSAALAGMMIGQ